MANNQEKDPRAPAETPVGSVVGGGVTDPDAHVEPTKKEATPAKPSEGVLPAAAAHVTTPKLQVDQATRRSDEDALTGHLCTVIKGEHQGKTGVFLHATSYDKDGYPKEAFVRFTDTAYGTGHAIVPYKDLRPKLAGTTP